MTGPEHYHEAQQLLADPNYGEPKGIGRTPVWKPATIIAWNETERRGQGTRTDLGRPAGH